MRITKEELEKQLSIVKDTNSEYAAELRLRSSKIDKLEREIKAKEQTVETFEEQKNKIIARLNNVILILAGSSCKYSKAEAIEDLFSVEVHHKKEEIKERKNSAPIYNGGGIRYG